MLIKAPAFTAPALSPEGLAVFLPRVQMSAVMLDVHPWTHSFFTRRKCPLRNWREQVDVQTLDITSGHNCILGQVCGYSRGCEHLELDEPDRVRFGFLPPYLDDKFTRIPDSWLASPSSLLTATWQYELTRAA
jgi:hypothetical protein